MKTRAFGSATIQGAWPVLEEACYGDPAKSYFAILDALGGTGLGDQAVQDSMTVLREILNADLGNENDAIGFELAERMLSRIAKRIHEKLLSQNLSLSLAQRRAISLLMASVGRDHSIRILNFGACSAYVFRENRFHLVSGPQLWELPEDGLLLPRQALGLENSFLPEIRSFSGRLGDILVLHSSGFSLQFPGVSDFLSHSLLARSSGESMLPLAESVLAEFAASSAFYNQSLLLLEV